MASLQEIIGARIRQFREMKGYSLEELAHQADLNQSHLSKVERGVLNFTLETLEKVLIALDISYSSFFQFEDPVPREENPIIGKTVSCMKNMTLEEQKHLYKTAVLIYQKRDTTE